MQNRDEQKYIELMSHMMNPSGYIRKNKKSESETGIFGAIGGGIGLLIVGLTEKKLSFELLWPILIGVFFGVVAVPYFIQKFLYKKKIERYKNDLDKMYEIFDTFMSRLAIFSGAMVAGFPVIIIVLIVLWIFKK